MPQIPLRTKNSLHNQGKLMLSIKAQRKHRSLVHINGYGGAKEVGQATAQLSVDV